MELFCGSNYIQKENRFNRNGYKWNLSYSIENWSSWAPIPILLRWNITKIWTNLHKHTRRSSNLKDSLHAFRCCSVLSLKKEEFSAPASGSHLFRGRRFWSFKCRIDETACWQLSECMHRRGKSITHNHLQGTEQVKQHQLIVLHIH